MNILTLFRRQRKNDITQPVVGTGRRLFTFIVIAGETARPRRIQLPGWLVFSLGAGLVAVTSASAALSIRYFQARQSIRELAELRRDVESIRNEATALYGQLLDVQSNLNQVDDFSNQVREATKIDDEQGSRPANPTQRRGLPPGTGDKPSTKGPLGILDRLRNLPEPVSAKMDIGLSDPEGGVGPLSKEDYEMLLKSRQKPQNLTVAGKVNPSSLAFGQVFAEVESVREQSSHQIDELTQLLTDVHQYRQKIDQTPTFAPVDGRLTSTFGVRESPFSKNFAMHRGLDIAAPLGAPIRAAAAGTVVKVGRAADYGKFVQLRHGKNLFTVYAHAQQTFVRAGEQVHKGQKIASVGMTGRTTGPHLHFEVRIGNQRVNPARYISFNRDLR